MRGVYQTRLGFPHGNCFAAAVASILECTITEVPDVPAEAAEEQFYEIWNDWLAALNLRTITFHVRGLYEDPGDPPWARGYGVLNVRSLLATPEREILHAVVWLAGRVVWDPDPRLGHEVRHDYAPHSLTLFQTLDPAAVYRERATVAAGAAGRPPA